MCRSRRELSNEALIAKFDVDTVENEHSKVWPACPPQSPPLGRSNSDGGVHVADRVGLRAGDEDAAQEVDQPAHDLHGEDRAGDLEATA